EALVIAENDGEANRELSKGQNLVFSLFDVPGLNLFRRCRLRPDPVEGTAALPVKTRGLDVLGQRRVAAIVFAVLADRIEHEGSVCILAIAQGFAIHALNRNG